jgi:cytosine/creatinine deaminase
VPTHQLVVAEGTVRGRDGRRQIGIDDGRSAAVTRDVLTGRAEIDAAGGLVASSTHTTTYHLATREGTTP